MTGDCHVRFCGNAKVKFLCVTRLEAMQHKASSIDYRTENGVQPDNVV